MNTDTNEPIEELFPLYALGALSEEEAAKVEAYVDEHPESRKRLESFLQTASALPFASEPVEPSAHVKARIMGRVSADMKTHELEARPERAPRVGFLERLREYLTQRPALQWGTLTIAVASLVLAIVTSRWALSLQREIDELHAENAQLRQAIVAQEEVITQISLPGARAITVAGTDQQPGAGGQLIADPSEGRGLLIVSGLERLREGLTYQIWLIKGEQPISAGLFTVDEQGQGIAQVQSDTSLVTFDAIGVSIEPEGGSESPTGNIVILSRIGF